ncbi:DUF4238 domain-containing protein [Kocuria rhizophila]|nr:DUF4238 domain-containing protein [Kocuria rhizophila]MDV6000241.1 DUF4238 domain-containing protein [Kocuria rhizophila]
MLLKRFSESERIYVVNKDLKSKRLVKNLKKASAINNYYHVPLNEVEPDARDWYDSEGLEKLFSRIESGAESAISQIASGHPLKNLQQRSTLDHFVSAQFSRVPKFENDIEDGVNRRLRETHFNPNNAKNVERTKKYLQEIGERCDTQAAIRLLDKTYSAEWRARMPIGDRVMSITRVWESLREELRGRYLHTLNFKSPSLILGDSPVVGWNRNYSNHKYIGIANSWEIIMPVDRFTVICYSKTPKRDLYFNESTIAGGLNSLQLESAFRAVHVHPEDLHVLCSQ